MEVRVFESAADMGHHVAEQIAAGLTSAAAQDTTFVLGFPAGRSALPVLSALFSRADARDLPLERLRVAMMDAYVATTASGHADLDADLPHSCQTFAQREIIGPVNALLTARGTHVGMNMQDVWIPEVADLSSWDRKVTEAGGVDLFLLASGSGDGHVAFNSPPASRDSEVRVARLSESTRRDNMRTYPNFRELGEVPTHGVTVGIDTLVRTSSRATLLLPGREKAEAWSRVTSVSDFEPSWPATVIHACRSPAILADRAAADARAMPAVQPP